MSKILNWFKFNAIRYFELDEFIENNKNNNYPYINNSNNIRSFKYDSEHSIYSWRNFGSWINNNWFSKQFSRCRTKDNRNYTFKSNTGQQPFFIDEVRNHYTILNQVIYLPLSNIITQDNENGIKSRLELNTTLNEQILSHPFIQHLQNDNNNLFQEIQNLIHNINQHNFMIEQMMYTKDKIVKNKFIENGIFPVYENNYRSLGYYHFQDVSHVLEIIWTAFVISRDIELELSRFDFNTREQILRAGGFIIGRGNDENELTEMQRIFEQVVRDPLILNSLIRLSGNRQQLVARINQINTFMRNLSRAIQENRYRTLCECCPTLNPNIWNFG